MDSLSCKPVVTESLFLFIHAPTMASVSSEQSDCPYQGTISTSALTVTSTSMSASTSESEPCNLLSILPEELLLHATSFLDISSLMRFKTLNKQLNIVCAKDNAGWINLCQTLWNKKIFIPVECLNNPSMASYRASLHDAKTRQHVRYEEFVFDLETDTGTIWSFRFKDAAGPDWTSWDPWWNGRRARQMAFCSDGVIRQYVTAGTDHREDLIHIDHENVQGRMLSSGRGMLLDAPVPMGWRFCSHPMDMPKRELGSYIRLTVGGRDVPTYVVRRSPTGNWGFLAESCWGVYTSFELPTRQSQEQSERSRRRGTRNMTGNGFADGSDGDDLQSSLEYELLADDSNLQVTNELQWREALLYNFGAVSLPEGEQAGADFDRMVAFEHVLRRQPGDDVGTTVHGDDDSESSAEDVG